MPLLNRTQTMDEAPSNFYCPITHEIMREPLMNRAGLNYERSAIVSWLCDHNNTCPLTRQPLALSDLVPNRNLQFRIEAWRYAYERQGNALPHPCEDAPVDVFACSMHLQEKTPGQKKANGRQLDQWSRNHRLSCGRQ